MHLRLLLTYLLTLLPVTCTDFVPHDASLWHAVAVTVKVLVELSHLSGNMEHKSAPVTHRKAASETIAAGHVSAACVASVALHAYVSEMLESALLQPLVAVACRLISVLDVAPVTSPCGMLTIGTPDATCETMPAVTGGEGVEVTRSSTTSENA